MLGGLSGSFDAKLSAFVIKFNQEKLGDMLNKHNDAQLAVYYYDIRRPVWSP
jgi:crotonobetainyl-CoA:carnitine CoA-transferase CaiB-like acyl-CoA transferase